MVIETDHHQMWELIMLLTIDCRKAGLSFDFETNDLPVNSILYACRRAFHDAINDAHASVTAKAYPDPDERAQAAKDKATAVAAKIRDGSVGGPARTAAAPKVDKHKVVEFVKAMSDDEFAAILEAFTESRKAA